MKVELTERNVEIIGKALYMYEHRLERLQMEHADDLGLVAWIEDTRKGCQELFPMFVDEE
jgi:hypothetical protein